MIKTDQIERYLTKFKYNEAVFSPSGRAGAYDSFAVDCPFVFFHNDKYQMLHVGFDGKGYQTALAYSEDLLHWHSGKVIFSREDGNGWDHVGVAGLWILKEDGFDKKPVLKKYKGKYWMVYHSYPNEGYESGSAQIGLAYTEDEDLLEWTRCEEPVLSWKNGKPWEQGGLYKGCLIEEKGKFYLFYNAKEIDEEPWHEQIGLALSDDMFKWERWEDNPVIPNTHGSWDSRFSADPYILNDNGKWVMYYYGFDGKAAREGIAFSDDLFHWEKLMEPILYEGKEGDIDRFHAHKPSVMMKDGILYHFYCAVRESRDSDDAVNISTVEGERTEYRCIAVATNKELETD